MEYAADRRSPRRHMLAGIALMALGALAGSLAVSSVSVSLAEIAMDIHTGTGAASAAVIVYLLVLSGLFLFFGKLGDVWGYRRVFLAGTGVFVAGSFLCGMSDTVNELIAFRIIQATGAAMITSVGPAYIMRHVPEDWHGRGLAYVSGAAVLGIIIGPSFGRMMTDVLGWEWIFFVNIPVCVLMLIAGWFVLEEDRAGPGARRFDLTGAVLFSCASVTLVLAISSVHVFSATNLITISFALFTFAFWTLAIVYESAVDDPAFEIALFKNRHFTTANIAYILLKMVFNGPVFLFPFYLHLVLGWSYELTGLVVIVPGAAMLLSCPGAGSLTDRYSPRLLCAAGAAGAAAVYLFFAVMPVGLSLPVVILALVVLGIARGVFLVPNAKLILDHSPDELKGAASGIMKALGNTGIILGIVIFQIAFSETLLAGEAAALYHHDPFTVPMPAIVAGFQVAFFLAAALSIAALALSWHTRDADVPREPVTEPA